MALSTGGWKSEMDGARGANQINAMAQIEEKENQKRKTQRLIGQQEQIQQMSAQGSKTLENMQSRQHQDQATQSQQLHEKAMERKKHKDVMAIQGQGHENTMSEMGQKNVYQTGQDNRLLAGRMKMAGAEGPEVENLMNTTGDQRAVTSGITVPQKQQAGAQYSMRTLDDYDDQGQKIGQRLIGMNQSTGQIQEYGGGQGMPGQGSGQPSILERMKAGKVDPNNMTPEEEMEYRQWRQSNPGQFQAQ